MAYSPTDWFDGVTPVDEAHLDKLEQGVVVADANATTALANAAAANAALPAKEDKALKGVAGGYAPLDGSAKVPAANLPPPPAGGADLSFDGDWVAGTYQDGDVVVKDGVAFICVGGPTTDVPSTTPWGLAVPGLATIGTTLPAAPVDGQEAILVDSLTAPTYQWRFRYTASITDAYKWVFIGGSEKLVELGLENGTANAVEYDLPTVGPSFLVPRAGNYSAKGIAGVTMPLANSQATITLAIGAGAGTETYYSTQPAAGFNIHCNSRRGYVGLAANAEIRMRYLTFGAGASAAWSGRKLSVLPMRVA